MLIFDFVAGNCNISFVTMDEGSLFELKASTGESHLGDRFVNRMPNHFVRDVKRKHRKGMKSNAKFARRLRNACARAKRAISFAGIVTVDLEYLYVLRRWIVLSFLVYYSYLLS